MNGSIRFKSENEIDAREFHKKYGGVLYESNGKEIEPEIHNPEIDGMTEDEVKEIVRRMLVEYRLIEPAAEDE